MAQFDYGIIGAPAPRAKLSLLADFNRGRDDMRMQQLRDIMGEELGSGKPNLNRMLQGYSQVDPAAAFNVSNENRNFMTKLMDKEPESKRSIRELEQLWKDATRSYNYAAQTSDEVGKKRYRIILDNLERQLKTLRPETWGDIDANGNDTKKTDTKTDTVDTTEGIKQQLRESAIDENNDGLIDRVSSWKDQIVTWQRANKLADNDGKVKEVYAYAENLIKEIADVNSAARAKTEQWQDDYKNYVETRLPNINTIYQNLESFRSKLINAISQAKRSKAGGAYAAMKGVLGDALSAADLAGMTGAGFEQGIIGKIKDFFGATTLTDSEAEKFMDSAIEGFNLGVDNYKTKFDTKTEFGKRAYESYKVNKITNSYRAKDAGSVTQDKPQGWRPMSDEELMKIMKGTKGGNGG